MTVAIERNQPIPQEQLEELKASLALARPETTSAPTYGPTWSYINRVAQSSRRRDWRSATFGLTTQLLEHPEGMVDSLRILDEAQSTFPDSNLADIPNHVLTSLTQRIRGADINLWAPNIIQDMVRCHLDSAPSPDSFLHQASRDILKTWFTEAPLTSPTAQALQRAADLRYNATIALAQTNDPEVKEWLLSLLCFENSDILPANSTTAQVLRIYRVGPLPIREKLSISSHVVTFINLIDDPSSTMIYYDAKRTGEANEALRQGQDSESHQTTLFLRKVLSDLKSRDPQRYAAMRDEAENPTPTQTVQKKSDPFLEELSGVQQSLNTRVPEEEDQVLKASSDPLLLHLIKHLRPQFARIFSKNQAEHLERLGYQGLNSHPIELSDNLIVNIFSNLPLVSLEQRQDLVREVLQALATQKNPNSKRTVSLDLEKTSDLRLYEVGYSTFYDQEEAIAISIFRTDEVVEQPLGRLASILEFHRKGDIGLEEAQKAVARIKERRSTIRPNLNRLIMARGYESPEVRPAVRNLGYESFTFRREKGSDIINAKVKISGTEYNFLIDSYSFCLIPGGDITRFASTNDRVWFEFLALSHLYGIMCHEKGEANLEKSLVGGRRQVKRYSGQINKRGEHLKRMAGENDIATGTRPKKTKDQGPYKIRRAYGITKQADQRYQNSELPHFNHCKDLAAVNEEKARIGKGGTKETGFWTYVQATPRDDLDDVPMKIALKPDPDFEEIFALDTPSDDEVDRVVEEILAQI